ncbi:MAG TPA: hypothetical protein VHD36_06475 [Pirellulales bacterium]|nr:hypothetical protein [Pirellulales bacterium]
MRGLRGLLPALALVAIGCQSRPQAMDPFVRTRIPPPATGDVGPIPTGAYGAPVATSAPPPPGYAPPGGSFSYGGGQLTPVTPPPGAAPPASSTFPGSPPPPAAAPPTGPYGAPATPTYQTPGAMPTSAPPPAGSPPYSPPGGGWAPTSSVNGPPTTSMYSRETMQRELRPLGETTRAGVLGAAANDIPSDAGIAPGEQGLDPGDKLSKTPMASPLQDAQDTRAIEPASYNMPQGAPPRVIQGAYAAVGPSNRTVRQASSTAVVAGKGPTDRGATYGYDSNYAWLQGQLEYSDATKQWKLRYVPVSGPTDKYGGSVVLAPSPALAGFRAGDFVSVKGKVAGASPNQGSYAPLYQVSAADRLTD